MSEGYVDLGFDSNDGGFTGKRERFKGRDNERYRISFVWWPGLEEDELDMDAETPKFIGAKRHYVPGAGYILNKGPEYTKLLGDAPKSCIGSVIVQWPTDSTGKLDAGRLASGDFKVLPWTFGADKYETIKGVHREFPMGDHDLKIHCTDAQFQKMTFTPTKDNVLRKLMSAGGKKKTLVDQILELAKEAVQALPNDIARDMTLDQVREKLGESVSAPIESAGSTDDLDGVLDNVLDD
jgi:hypothetical protein